MIEKQGAGYIPAPDKMKMGDIKMELKHLVDLYSFGKPMRVLLYTEKPFCVTSESYVVDGKLIADNGDTVCNDINVLDYKHGYNLFMLEHDADCLIAKICHMANA